MAIAVRSTSAYVPGSAGFNPGTIPLTTPTGTTAGDLLVIVVLQSKDGATAPTCAGFTLAGAVAGGTRAGANGPSAVLYKVATGSEPGSYSVTVSGTANAMIYALTGANTTAPIDVNPAYTVPAAGTTALAASSLTVSAGALLITGYSVLSGTPTFGAVTGMTAGANPLRAGNYVSSAVSHQLISTAGATGTRTCTASAAGTGTPQTMAVAVAPAVVAPTGPGGAFLPFFA